MGDFQPKPGQDEPLPELDPLEPGTWEKPWRRGPCPYGYRDWDGLVYPDLWAGLEAAEQDPSGAVSMEGPCPGCCPRSPAPAKSWPGNANSAGGMVVAGGTQ